MPRGFSQQKNNFNFFETGTAIESLYKRTEFEILFLEYLQKKTRLN